MPRILQTTVAALASASVVMGHTWIEQLRNIDDKGNYVGQYGYPRGMFAKTDPGYDGNKMNFELPATQQKVFIDETTPLCHPSQRKQVQSNDKYPRLQATPGGFVAMRYSENGHVTLVDPATGLGKPNKGGTVFVYGTTEPKEDETLVEVLRWTEDGQGGDKRGKLLTMNNFDDGRCYENNKTPINAERTKLFPNYAFGQASDNTPGNYPLWCETNVQIPKTADVGKPLTMYWVWQWNTAPKANPILPTGKDEYYTTCMDVDVTSANKASKADAAGPDKKYALGQQDAMSVAVKDWASRTAIITAAIDGEVGPVFSSQPTPSLGAPGSAPPKNSPSASRVPGGPQPSSKISRTRRPHSKPTNLPSGGAGGAVTVTDTVYLTVTAQPSGQAPPAAATSVNAKPSSAAGAPPAAGTPSLSKAPPAGVPSASRTSAPPASSASQPSGPVSSGKLPGFEFGKPPSAKFRRMYK